MNHTLTRSEHCYVVLLCLKYVFFSEDIIGEKYFVFEHKLDAVNSNTVLDCAVSKIAVAHMKFSEKLIFPFRLPIQMRILSLSFKYEILCKLHKTIQFLPHRKYRSCALQKPISAFT